MALVAPGGANELDLGRNEFNVLLALGGLAQEGEVVSLDGVDERRRGMWCFSFLFSLFEFIPFPITFSFLFPLVPVHGTVSGRPFGVGLFVASIFVFLSFCFFLGDDGGGIYICG